MVSVANRSVRGVVLSFAAVLASGCCCPASYRGPAGGAAVRSTAVPVDSATLSAIGIPADSVTETLFRHVDFDIGLGIVLGVRYLRGEMRSSAARAPIVFDDKRSFGIFLDTAEVALSTQSLGHLMNGYIFAYPRAPLRNLSFTVAGDRLVQRGILHKVVDIPFEMTASLSVTPEGWMRIRPTSMKICSLDGEGLMSALGIKLSNLIDVRGAKGVTVSGNDLLIDLNRALPPPVITGRLVSVRVEGGGLVQTFGRPAGPGPAPAALSPPDTSAPNYMYFRGGTLRFGKLLMVPADMQVIDLEPATPFEFSIDDYQSQLVAGYSRSGSDMSLRVFMPDHSSLGMHATEQR